MLFLVSRLLLIDQGSLEPHRQFHIKFAGI